MQLDSVQHEWFIFTPSLGMIYKFHTTTHVLLFALFSTSDSFSCCDARIVRLHYIQMLISPYPFFIPLHLISLPVAVRHDFHYSLLKFSTVYKRNQLVESF